MFLDKPVIRCYSERYSLIVLPTLMESLSRACRYIVLAGIFVIPFLVFYVSSTLFFPFITGKNFAFRIIVEVIFGAWVLLALADAQYRPRRSPLLIAAGVFTAVVALADFMSVSPFKSIWSNFERMEGLVMIVHLFMYFIVAGSVMTTRRLWTALLNTSVAVSVITAFYGILQLAGKFEIHQGGVRLDATFGNASYLAVYMLMHLFITAFLLARAEGGRALRLAYGVAMALQALILYYTATRGAILGAIGGAIVAAGLIALFQKDRPAVRTYALALVGGVILVTGVFLAAKNTAFVQNSPVLSRFASISFESDGNTRFILWGMALKGVAEHPVLGWGQESFNFVFNEYYDPRLYAQEPWFDRVHNIVLDWLIAGGILGLAAYLALFGAALFVLWRSRATWSAVDAALLTGLFAGYFFNNLFVFDNAISYIYFFTLLAFIHAGAVRDQVPTGRMAAPVDQAKRMRVGVPLVVIATIFSLYAVNVRGILANQTLLQALVPHETPLENLEYFKKAFAYRTVGRQEVVEQLSMITLRIQDSDLPAEIKTAFAEEAAQDLELLIKEQPGDTRLHLFAGSFYRAFGVMDQALAHLERARELSPGKQTTYFELGSTLIANKEYNKAFELLKHAYDMEPRFDQARVNYAVGAAFIGREDIVDEMVALKLAEHDAQGGTFSFDDRLIQAYITLNEYKKIVAFLEEAVKRAPTNSQYHVSLAAAYDRIGRRDKAIKALEQAIELNPGFKDQGEYYIEALRAGRTP